MTNNKYILEVGDILLWNEEHYLVVSTFITSYNNSYGATLLTTSDGNCLISYQYSERTLMCDEATVIKRPKNDHS